VQNNPTKEEVMTAKQIVARYYDAWQNKRGDLSEVPLAEDFRFTGPVASFDSAEGYRAMAREAGQAVTTFQVRRQFVDGDTVCSIIDWDMAIPGVGPMTSAELLEVRDGVILRGELIYDAEELRRAMAHAGPDAAARAKG
jgi:ketosteroid isomerase-like protein